MPEKSKPVLFWDFHGTLTLPGVNWFDAAMEAAAEAVPDAALDPSVLKRHFHGACLPWFEIPEGDTRHVAGTERWWAFCEKEFCVMLQKCGFTAQQAGAVAPRMREKILRAEGYELYPDAEATLLELGRRGYKSYILSNNFPELDELAAEMGIAHWFEKVLVSGQIGYEKPRPEIFEEARRAAGSPEEVWMIGDNPRDDIAGGKEAGFVTVLAHGGHSPHADHLIGDLGEILALLP